METDADQLKTRYEATKTRSRVAATVGACAALLGVVGLLSPGNGPIFGLLSLALASLVLSYAIRQRALRDESARKLERLDRENVG